MNVKAFYDQVITNPEFVIFIAIAYPLLIKLSSVDETNILGGEFAYVNNALSLIYRNPLTPLILWHT